MTTEIFMVSGGAAVHVVVPPGEYIIGREEEADIHIPDPSVSARHARLVVDRESVCIQDLDSENGTFIEGEPAVGLTSLYDGQSAVLGSVSLRVRQSTDPQSLGEGPRYVRGSMVAYGGMGAIHEARQSAMGRKVAMKVMLHSWNAASVKRFLDEARITGMLEHPNIVPVHEMGVDDEDQFFYTMKFVRGATLAEVIAGISVGNGESVKKFPLAALLTIFQKVCDAVAFAHSRGVFHRDLKPENIMIGDFGEVLVMDWGLAKESGFVSLDAVPDGAASLPAPETATASGSASLRTMEGMVLGTPTYMSPEQARGETSAVDHRSDIYSLGAILHEILYLQPPVRGKNRERVIEKVATGVRDEPEPRALAHLPGQRAPASLEAVCRKAMAFEPARRYQKVTDLQADLTAYQSGFATSAESAGLGKHLVLFVKRNRGVSFAVAAGVVALFAASLLFTLNLVSERNRAEAAQARAEDNERKAKEALARALDMEGQKNTADREAEQARNDEQAALAEAEAAKTSAEERQKMLEEKNSSLAADARRFSLMAHAAAAEGRVDDALQLFDTAVSYSPENAAYLKQHGLALLAAGRYAEAADRFRLAGAREELGKAEEMSQGDAKNGAPSRGAKNGLEKFLIGEGHAPYVRLIDASSARREDANSGRGEQKSAAAELAGKELILHRLGSLAKRADWDESRVRELEGGVFAVDLSNLQMKNLPDLVGTGAVELNLEGTGIFDISVLRGLSLRSLNLARTKVSDLSPLQNMPELAEIRCSALVSDLSPLQGAPLVLLDIRGSRVSSLEPVGQARLKTLLLGGSKVSDLQPVAGQPVEELDADVEGLDNLAQIEGMKNLVKLKLPRGTGPIDPRAMPSLQEIFIPDLKPDGPLSGDEYRELDELRRKSWEQYSPVLSGLGLKEFGPDKLIYRQKEGGFDLDLRGTGITDLKPLAKLPIHRLFLDTKHEPLDVGPLGSHPTLRHLSLENAWVPSIARLAQNKQLVSLVLSRDTTDTSLLAKHPGIQRLGYQLGKDGLSPSGAPEDFFAGAGDRAADEGAKYAFRFDAAAEGAGGWTIDDGAKPEPVALWVADLKAEGGAGGGYVSFYERKANGRPAFFVGSPEIGRNLRDLHGGALEFRMRVGREVQETERVQVQLVTADKVLFHTSRQRPREAWTSVVVPLNLNGEWRTGRADGAFATDVELREALARVREVRIKAEYAGDALDERTDLDDVKFWTTEAAAARGILPGNVPR